MDGRNWEMLGVEGCGLFRGDVFWSNDYKEKSGQRFPLESNRMRNDIDATWRFSYHCQVRGEI